MLMLAIDGLTGDWEAWENDVDALSLSSQVTGNSAGTSGEIA